jgi:hypothetical protein
MKEWYSILIYSCIGFIIGFLMRKLNSWDYDSYESPDELYTDGEGTFLNKMMLSIERKKYIFKVELLDKTTDELLFIWCFGNDTENWDFGIKYTLICIKENLNMKHVVKMVAYIDTEETDLIKLGELGLEKIKKEIESGVCVVDVYKNCVSVEMVCVNINESKKNAIEESKKTD